MCTAPLRGGGTKAETTAMAAAFIFWEMDGENEQQKSVLRVVSLANM